RGLLAAREPGARSITSPTPSPLVDMNLGCARSAPSPPVLRESLVPLRHKKTRKYLVEPRRPRRFWMPRKPAIDRPSASRTRRRIDMRAAFLRRRRFHQRWPPAAGLRPAPVRATTTPRRCDQRLGESKLHYR